VKPQQIYEALKELAEKLGITVLEQNLKNMGINVHSGLCKVKGDHLFVMDKHKTIQTKNRLLAECLGNMPHEQVFVVPVVRDLLTRYSAQSNQSDEGTGKG